MSKFQSLFGSVCVADPNAPLHVLQPNADGSINIASPGTVQFSANQVIVDNVTPTLIAASREGREAITIVNMGTIELFIGPDSSVTTADGMPIIGTNGAALTIPTEAEVWGIALTGPQTVGVLETF